MRYPASEKAEIVHLVEQSHLPAKHTLDKLGIPRATFYRWYDRYREGELDPCLCELAMDACKTGIRADAFLAHRFVRTGFSTGIGSLNTTITPSPGSVRACRHTCL